MSGTIAALSVGALSLAVDAQIGDEGVSLGDFVFDQWEVPEKIEWGGSQRIYVHKLIGGQRVIDAMGRDDSDITWSGVFLSIDASLRADQLDQMRIGGQVQELIFCGRYYQVVIKDFRADQQKPWHVPYTITCSVLSDQSAIDTDPNAISPLSQVIQDVTSATQYASTGVAEAQAVIASVVPPLVLLPVIDPVASATIAIATSLTSASALVAAAAVASDVTIATTTAGAAAAGNLVQATTVDGAIAAMQTVSAATQDAAMAAAMGGYVNRSLTNIAEA